MPAHLDLAKWYPDRNGDCSFGMNPASSLTAGIANHNYRIVSAADGKNAVILE